MIICHWRHFNSREQEYEGWYKILAGSKEELDSILEDFENRGIERSEVTVDDSNQPTGFGYAGGFCSELLSVKDELGNDRSDWTNEWYGPPRRRGARD